MVFPLRLSKYAEIFPVVEVQQTFYKPPLPRTLEKWRKRVPEEFEFTLKAWQLITHEATSPTFRRLRGKITERQKREAGSFRANETVMAAWERTLECARSLRSRIILFQCPARFVPTPVNKANLRAFFRAIGRGRSEVSSREEYIYVWEPRGEWKPDEIRELCEELGLVHGVDPLHQQPTTGNMQYFRLHGRSGYRYQFTASDLDQLLKMTAGSVSQYVLFNNVSMFEDAKRFLQLTRSR